MVAPENKSTEARDMAADTHTARTGRMLVGDRFRSAFGLYIGGLSFVSSVQNMALMYTNF